MRDHFEGTPLDMTRDIGAGPYQLPYRWRPAHLEGRGRERRRVLQRARRVDSADRLLIRGAGSRSWLPDPIGGILWFGVDDTYSTVYFPMYCGATRVPKSFAVGTGDFHTVTWESAFWVFNQVANYAYLRYSEMITDIQKVQGQLEGALHRRGARNRHRRRRPLRALAAPGEGLPHRLQLQYRRHGGRALARVVEVPPL